MLIRILPMDFQLYWFLMVLSVPVRTFSVNNSYALKTKACTTIKVFILHTLYSVWPLWELEEMEWTKRVDQHTFLNCPTPSSTCNCPAHFFALYNHVLTRLQWYSSEHIVSIFICLYSWFIVVAFFPQDTSLAWPKNNNNGIYVEFTRIVASNLNYT